MSLPRLTWMIIDHRSWSTIFVVYVEMVISLIGLASSIWNRMFRCILDGLCLPCFLYLRYDLEVIDSVSYIKDWLGNFSLVLLAHHASCIMLVIRLVQTSFKNLFDTIQVTGVVTWWQACRSKLWRAPSHKILTAHPILWFLSHPLAVDNHSTVLQAYLTESFQRIPTITDIIF